MKSDSFVGTNEYYNIMYIPLKTIVVGLGRVRIVKL